jgi:hypothetical protein
MGMTYKRDAVWWVKYYLNGRPIRESSHSAKESDAIKTRSVFERYKIVSECDLVEAAKKLNLLQWARRSESRPFAAQKVDHLRA